MTTGHDQAESSVTFAGIRITYKKLERGAMAGDYQDQRNLAFALTGGYGSEIPKNPVLACAWRLVILASGDRRVDEGDVGNNQLYCD